MHRSRLSSLILVLGLVLCGGNLLPAKASAAPADPVLSSYGNGRAAGAWQPVGMVRLLFSSTAFVGGGGRSVAPQRAGKASRRDSIRSTRSVRKTRTPAPARQRGASIPTHVQQRVQNAIKPREVQKDVRTTSPALTKRLSVQSSTSNPAQRRASMQSLARSPKLKSERPQSMSLRSALRRSSVSTTRSTGPSPAKGSVRSHESHTVEQAHTRQSPEGKRATSSGDKPGFPPRNGFAGTPARVELKPGVRFDRFGSERGSYVSPLGTPFQARGLNPSVQSQPYMKYEVVKPFTVRSGLVAPWAGSPGGGTQYKLDQRVADLVKSGHLKRVD